MGGRGSKYSDSDSREDVDIVPGSSSIVQLNVEDGAPGDPLRGHSVEFLSSSFLQLMELTSASDARIYDIEPRIREFGKEEVCPRDGRMGAAFVDVAPDDSAGRATVMLSYAWGCQVTTIMGALAEHSKVKGMNPGDVCVWICCLCINQHRVKDLEAKGKHTSFDEFKRCVDRGVQDIKQVWSLLSPLEKPLNLSRAWCVYEMYLAESTEDVNLEFMLAPEDVCNFQGRLSDTNTDELWTSISSLRIEEGKASVDLDQRRILGQVTKGPGVSKVNDCVSSRLYLWFREAVEDFIKKSEETLGPEDIETLRLVSKLGSLLRAMGKPQEAAPLYQRVLDGREAKLGPDHVETLESMDSLGLMLKATGKLREAESLVRRSLEIKEVVLGPSHTSTLISANSLASLLQNMGRLHESEPLVRRVLEDREQRLGYDHSETLDSLSVLGNLLEAMGQTQEAEFLFRRGLNGSEAKLGSTHPRTLTLMNKVAVMLENSGRRDKQEQAEALYRKAVAVSTTTLGANHPNTRTYRGNLVVLLRSMGKTKEAEEVLRPPPKTGLQAMCNQQ